MTEIISDAQPSAPIEDKSFIKIDQRKLAGVVGLVALLLPTLLVVAAFVELSPSGRTCYRDSISHYYYAPLLGSVFIGALVFIGAYLLAYQGTKQQQLESWLSTGAGIAAFCVALFPTSGDGCSDTFFRGRSFVPFERSGDVLIPKAAPIDDYFLMFDYAAFGIPLSSDVVHYAAAAILFAFLAWFSLKVFTKADPHQRNADGSLTQAKTIRNMLYYASGAVILLCMAAMGAYAYFDWPWWNISNLTFWFEAAALWAFGISWMVKARFWGWALKDPGVL